MKLLSVASSLLLCWVRIYTLGLPPCVRAERRALIESDLAEQLWDEADSGRTPLSSAISILSRTLRGSAADVSWRISDAARSKALTLTPGQERRPSMTARSSILLLSIWSGLSLAVLLVLALQPTRHSLAYASAILLLVALAGWLLEARQTADAQATTAESSSAWPLLLAISIAGIAGGLLIPAPSAGLIVASPMAVASLAAWTMEMRRLTPDIAHVPQLASTAVLANHVAAGDVIAIETLVSGSGFSRRSVLQAGFWLGLGSLMLAAGGAALDFLWQRNPATFGGVVNLGSVTQFPPGSKNRIQEGRFWMVHLTPEQGGPGLLALFQKCPHLGCTVPWEPEFRDAINDLEPKGWFRCPCHQSTYKHAGVRVYGPAPRSMDLIAVTYDPGSGSVSVDTAKIRKGTPENASLAVPVSPPDSGSN